MTAVIDRPELRQPVSRAVRPSRRRLGRNVAIQLVLWAYAVVAFAPLVLVLIGSLRSNRDILADPLGLPSTFDVSNYRRAWANASLGTYLVNSVVVTVGAVALCVAVSALVAYPLGRWSFRGRGVLTAYLLSGLMLPIKLGIVPIYYLLQSAGLVDSRAGLILVYAAGGIPLAVFILAAFFRQLPDELEEAAVVDGAGEGRLFWSVMLPMVRPAVATVVVFTVAPVWNDFFYPLVLLRSSEKYTLPVGLTSFFGQFSLDRGALFAALVFAAAPLVALFVVAMRQIVAGLTAGIGK